MEEKLGKKHKFTPSNNNEQANKKPKLFSAIEFRNQLKSDNKPTALNTFLQQIKTESGSDYVLNYLENDGTCTELLQTLEDDSNVLPTTVFEIVHNILLQINAKFPQYHNKAQDSCHYLLNKFTSLINKMLSLNATNQERVVLLKLLTIVATLSSKLAKEVLLNVKFHTENLELLTKRVKDNNNLRNEVRRCFVSFLVALLVDGHFSTLTLLLEKRYLLTSVIKGLKFDEADLVCLFLTAMRNNILENISIAKTIKMQLFNTQNVKEIVNLYNWKSVSEEDDQLVVVNELKSCVHEFLLVLCTSHKFGVIFKDYSMGLKKKSQNNLMYTVLDGLERPWEHSYANDLVIKICQACPDLTKTIWNSLKESLEPRDTIKWFTAMKFAMKLIEELKPTCLDYCSKDLNIYQLGQAINSLIVPVRIIKTLLPFDDDDMRDVIKIITENQTVKYTILLLLLEILKSLKNYLDYYQTNGFDHVKLFNQLSNRIVTNFPDAKFILLINWSLIGDRNYLNLMFDLFEFYQIFAPQLLESFNSSNFDLKNFLNVIRDKEIQIKAIRYFLMNESELFHPNNNLFEFTLQVLFEFYYNQPDYDLLTLLNCLLTKTRIFNLINNQVNVWINGFLNLKEFSIEIVEFLVKVVRESCKQITVVFNEKIMLEIALNFYRENLENCKLLRDYLFFVVFNLFHSIEQFNFNWNLIDFVSRNYLNSWLTNTNDEVKGNVLRKWKGRLDILQKFSNDFLNKFDTFLIDYVESYPGLNLNLLEMSLFYFSKSVDKKIGENCWKFVKFLLNSNDTNRKNYSELILNCPIFLNNLSLSANNYSMNLFLNILKEFEINSQLIVIDLSSFREKLFELILNLFVVGNNLRKQQEKSLEILKIIQLDYFQCYEILLKSANENESLISFSSIFVYCLGQFAKLCEENYNLKPLNSLQVSNLCNYFINSNNYDSSLVFLNYLKRFPHNIIDISLDYVEFLLNSQEFSLTNAKLIEFLFERNLNFFNLYLMKSKNLELFFEQKAMILNLLKIIICNDENGILKIVYEKLCTNILKYLQKPQKSTIHFRNNYQSIGYLIDKFMKKEICQMFVEKVQKFPDSNTEVFHVFLLGKIFEKFTNSTDMSNKLFTNITLTFINLLKNLFKQSTIDEGIFEIFLNFLNKIIELNLNLNLTEFYKNENYLQFVKFCLKHGISNEIILLKILTKLIELTRNLLTIDDTRLILEMLLTHSEFFEIILNDTKSKLELFELFTILIKMWPDLMQRQHIPILLTTYKATTSETDQVLLNLLKLYELNERQTKFFDFKPFLWGRLAANHYLNTQNNLQTVLFRQPRMSDVLDLLQPKLVLQTIKNSRNFVKYDLNFLLPLFNMLLSFENNVQLYRFTKSGALSLTIFGLSSNIKSIRLCSCHVLSRYYTHLESKQTGKDNLLWLRLIKVICLGLIETKNVDDDNLDLKLNNFVTLFLTKSAMILTQPINFMYLPITKYLTTKSILNFNNKIPELLTFLFSSDLNYKIQRNFILEILNEGLQNQNDFNIFLKSMAFKLISELYTSVVCDYDSRLLILDIYLNCCINCPNGMKILCKSHSFLIQIYNNFLMNLKTTYSKERKGVYTILNKLIELLLEMVKIHDSRHDNFLIFSMIMLIVEENFLKLIRDQILVKFYEILIIITKRFPQFFTDNYVNLLLEQSNDKLCKYYFDFGCEFVKVEDFEGFNEKDRNLRLLFYNKFKK